MWEQYGLPYVGSHYYLGPGLLALPGLPEWLESWVPWCQEYLDVEVGLDVIGIDWFTLAAAWQGESPPAGKIIYAVHWEEADVVQITNDTLGAATALLCDAV